LRTNVFIEPPLRAFASDWKYINYEPRMKHGLGSDQPIGTILKTQRNDQCTIDSHYCPV
jgi:hypothetical protein